MNEVVYVYLQVSGIVSLCACIGGGGGGGGGGGLTYMNLSVCGRIL